MAEQDSRNSLRHILADDPVEEPTPAPSYPPPSQVSQPVIASREDQNESSGSPRRDDGEDEHSRDPEAPQYTSTTQTTRRNANGSVSSVYSGNKIKHLKKEDGVPLWRKDIQYEFLKIVFDDESRVFTRYSDRSPGHTFAEIYIDAMAKSSKTSKILKEKLAQDHESAVSMAMVCLLVNVGRMNTTLNFFPEMRAQLRTYHSIPALQAHQDPNAYKQLQDAPRLKSILKGASEDDPQPGTVEEIKAAQVPRTNPVNLIFVLAQYAPKISEVHFSPPRDFFDLVMRPLISSKSRATAFLWLLWWYLESNFTYEDSQRNPFGPGQDGEQTGGLPIKVPTLESLSEEQAALENVDTEEERLFGEIKRKERIAIVASEPSPAMTALKRARKERSLQAGFGYAASGDEGTFTPSRDYQSPVPQGSAYSNMHQGYNSSEHTRSPSPPLAPSFQAVNLAPKPSTGMNISAMLSNDEPEPHPTPPPAVIPVADLPPPDKKKGPGRGNWRRPKERGSSHHEPHPLLPNTAVYMPQNSPGAPQTPANFSYSAYPQTLSPVSAFSGPAHFPLAPALPTGNSIESAIAHVPTPSYQTTKRNRPLTQHQIAISDYRRNRISYILDRGIRARQATARHSRRSEGSILRAWKRIRLLPSGWDSEEEEMRLVKENEKREDESRADEKRAKDAKETKDVHSKRPIGGVWMAGYVMPNLQEMDDVGEGVTYLARAVGSLDARIRDWDARGPTLVRPSTTAVGDRRIKDRRRREREREIMRERDFEYQREREVVEGGRVALEDVAKTSGTIKKGKSNGTASGKKRAQVKMEDTTGPEDQARDREGGGDDMDVDENGAELDEEDRELLGELDADESEDDEDDGDDEDGMED